MPPPPTGAELEILAALWQRGPTTVRQVHEIRRVLKEFEKGRDPDERDQACMGAD